MAGVRGPGRRLHGQVQGGAGGRQEGEGGVRDGHQAPQEAQPPQHRTLQVSTEII